MSGSSKEQRQWVISVKVLKILPKGRKINSSNLQTLTGLEFACCLSCCCCCCDCIECEGFGDYNDDGKVIYFLY